MVVPLTEVITYIAIRESRVSPGASQVTALFFASNRVEAEAEVLKHQ